MNITEGVILASIAAIPNIIASVAALLISIKNNTGIKEIKVATDGMKNELVASTRRAAFSEGIGVGTKAGISSEKERLSEVVSAVASARNGDFEFPEERRS